MTQQKLEQMGYASSFHYLIMNVTENRESQPSAVSNAAAEGSRCVTEGSEIAHRAEDQIDISQR